MIDTLAVAGKRHRRERRNERKREREGERERESEQRKSSSSSLSPLSVSHSLSLSFNIHRLESARMYLHFNVQCTRNHLFCTIDLMMWLTSKLAHSWTCVSVVNGGTIDRSIVTFVLLLLPPRSNYSWLRKNERWSMIASFDLTDCRQ